MNIRITAVDKLEQEEGQVVPRYVIYSELSWIGDHGKENIIEFQTELDRDDLVDFRRSVTERAYDVEETEQIAYSLVGQEWSVPDRVKTKALSA